MKDLLIARDVSFDSNIESTPFSVVSFEPECSKQTCDTVIPGILDFENAAEEFTIPTSIVDFKMPQQSSEEVENSEIVIIVPETCSCSDPESYEIPTISIPEKDSEHCSKKELVPENVVFAGIEGLPIETLIQHIKSESRDYFKGTSFRWLGQWECNRMYTSDEYFVDYVQYEGAMWVCLESHFSTTTPNAAPQYWSKVVDGIPGKDGKDAIHVGPNPPTREDYGEDFENILWIDTSDTSGGVFRVYSKDEIDQIIRDVQKEIEDKGYLTSIPSECITESELEDRLKDLDVKVDLTEYYNKSQVDAIISDLKDDFTGISPDDPQLGPLLQILERATTWLEYE